MSNLRDTSGELRKHFDGTGGFISGHQIINSNRARGGFKRVDAAWAHDDKAVRDLLVRVFPKLETDERQRVRAGRWMRVIQLHHRFGHSYSYAADEMKVSVSTVKSMLQHIRRAVKGFPCNRSSKTVKRATFGTSLGDQ
jgi:Sigma-70, region 4